MFVYAKYHSDVKDPVRKHSTDAGVDIFSNEDVTIWPFSMGVVGTGITAVVEPGTALLVWPKSGGNHIVGAGVVDAGYQGEIKVKILNYRPWPIRIRWGDPVAQLVKVKIFADKLRERNLWDIHSTSTERGESGGILLFK